MPCSSQETAHRASKREEASDVPEGEGEKTLLEISRLRDKAMMMLTGLMSSESPA